MRWVGPAAGTGPVTFWLAALAADGGGTGGDFTYTTSRTVNEATTTAVEDPIGGTRPAQFALAQNYPNPFNPSTTIDYFLPQASVVELAVFNMLGQKIGVIDRGPRSAGRHSARWNGTDRHGRPVAGGYYVYRLRAGELEEARGMLYLK
jgi:hypothetical protein